MYDGTVLQNTENKSPSLCGGGVNIRSGQFYMYDGSVITGCKARLGGGVEVNSVNNTGGAMFGMAGGSINNCSADGGGVYVNIGMFQIRGGDITSNRALSNDDAYGGGGIFAVGGSGSSKVGAVLVAGGKITGNTSQTCGGGAMLNGTYSQIQMIEGIIEKNNAINGGGVYIHRGMLSLYGGTITGNVAELYGGGVLNTPNGLVKLKGNPKVFENIAKDKDDCFDNLYLDGEVDGLPASPVWLVGPLTDGVNLGMSLWIRPDDNDHPYWPMIIPNEGYTISQSDIDRLCYDRSAENKELYADNMEKFSFIPYNGEIVMVLAVDVALDKEHVSFEGVNDLPVSLTATVTPDNAPEKGVTWSSSDENVATVDENGVVTPISEGRAVITATTKSPYHATTSCNVTVGYYQLETKAEHGTITYTPVEPDDYFPSGELVKLTVYADREYRLNSLKAYYTGDKSAEVAISNDTLVMPDCDVTVEAVFKPIPYKISYDLEEGALNQNETNPDSYTIESGEITLNNPIRSGYTFVGWTGTELTTPALVVKIPAGSTGNREYTAVWEKENSGEPTNSDSENTHHENSAPLDNNSEPPSNDTPSTSDDKSLTSDNKFSTLNENNPIPSESTPSYNDYNPSTGRAISFISLTAITVMVVVVVIVMREKK